MTESGLTVDVGWTGLAFNPSDKDSPLATALRRLGAVLYVKTNIPQSLMVRTYEGTHCLHR